MRLIWPVRVPNTVLQPTPQWLQRLGTLVNSQALAPKRKSRVVSAPTGVLVRPDGYVAWVGGGTDEGLKEALTTWFGPPAAS